MKRYFALILILAACSLSVRAQQPQVPVRPASEAASMRHDPAAQAMRESERLQKALGLTDKQTKKVYKFCYKHFKSETRNSEGSGGPGAWVVVLAASEGSAVPMVWAAARAVSESPEAWLVARVVSEGAEACVPVLPGKGVPRE